MELEDVMDKLKDLKTQLFESYFLSQKEKLSIIEQIKLHEKILDDLTIVSRFNARLERRI